MADPSKDPLAQYREEMAKKHEQQAKEQQAQQEAKKAAAANKDANKEPVSLNSTMKLKGDSDEAKDAFKKKQAERDLQEKLKDREKKKQQVNALRAKLAADKVERAEQNKSRLQKVDDSLVTIQAQQTAPVVQQQQQQQSQQKIVEVTLQIRLHDGKIIKHTLPSDQTLAHVAQHIVANCSDLTEGSFSIMTPFNRKDFQPELFEATSLGDAQLVPRGQIVVTKLANKGVVKKGDSAAPAPLVPPTGLGFGIPPVVPPVIPATVGAVPEVKPVVVANNSGSDGSVQSLLCLHKWIASVEECDAEQAILVFRPESYEFPEEIPRDVMQFFANSNCTGYDAATQSTSRGAFKIKQESDESAFIEVNLADKPSATFEVLELTSEILIVKLVL